jgi:hypothetical protein
VWARRFLELVRPFRVRATRCLERAKLNPEQVRLNPE